MGGDKREGEDSWLFTPTLILPRQGGGWWQGRCQMPRVSTQGVLLKAPDELINCRILACAFLARLKLQCIIATSIERINSNDVSPRSNGFGNAFLSASCNTGFKKGSAVLIIEIEIKIS
jgi:hypothetical protein